MHEIFGWWHGLFDNYTILSVIKCAVNVVSILDQVYGEHELRDCCAVRFGGQVLGSPAVVALLLTNPS